MHVSCRANICVSWIADIKVMGKWLVLKMSKASIVKVYNMEGYTMMMCVPCYCCRQLRFSLYSGAVTTKVLAIVVFLYYHLVLALWSILCLMPSCLVSCSALLLVLLFSLKELCLSEDVGLCSLFYPVHICIALWDSLYGLLHTGIACLASQAPDWAVAFWDGLSGLWLVTLWWMSIQVCLL